MENWVRVQQLFGLKVEVVCLEGCILLIFLEILVIGVEIGDDIILFYGYLDKQLEMIGWDDDFGLWILVLCGDKLYGRGGVDDGYVIFGLLVVVLVLQVQGLLYVCCVVLIEVCEEFGSYDLLVYVDYLVECIGKLLLVVCLDLGCVNYDQLWCIILLCGLIGGNFIVKVFNEGVYFGDVFGVVLFSFCLLCQLLLCIEDQDIGCILIDGMNVEILVECLEQVKCVVEVVDIEIFEKFLMVDGLCLMNEDLIELVFNCIWCLVLLVIGVGGMLLLELVGNVLCLQILVKLLLCLLLIVDGKICGELLKEVLLCDLLNGVQVILDLEKVFIGWNVLVMVLWLIQVIDDVSQVFFGKLVMYMGEGGLILFMGMLGEKFLGVQFMIIGVFGLYFNVYGLNEFLYILMGKKVIVCVFKVISEYYVVSLCGEISGLLVVVDSGICYGDYGCC